MSTRVFVGRLNYDVRESDLEKFFKGYGRIREILLKNGFGFVEFDDYRDADDAVYELNGKKLLGERVSVEQARGTPHGSDLLRGSRSSRGSRPPQRRRNGGDKYGPPTRTEYRLVVENLSSRVSWQDLKDYMRQAGEVTYADSHKQHRNEGVVEFATYADMKNALEKLHDTELNGRRIRLVEDKPRSSRRHRSRSRSHSHSRSKSRSRSRSHSRSRSKSRSKSHSKSRSKSTSRSPSKSKSRSRSRDRSKSHDHNKSKTTSRSRSRSKTPDKDNRSPKSKHDDD